MAADELARHAYPKCDFKRSLLRKCGGKFPLQPPNGVDKPENGNDEASARY